MPKLRLGGLILDFCKMSAKKLSKETSRQGRSKIRFVLNPCNDREGDTKINNVIAKEFTKMHVL